MRRICLPHLSARPSCIPSRGRGVPSVIIIGRLSIIHPSHVCSKCHIDQEIIHYHSLSQNQHSRHIQIYNPRMFSKQLEVSQYDGDITFTFHKTLPVGQIYLAIRTNIFWEFGQIYCITLTSVAFPFRIVLYFEFPDFSD